MSHPGEYSSVDEPVFETTAEPRSYRRMPSGPGVAIGLQDESGAHVGAVWFTDDGFAARFEAPGNRTPATKQAGIAVELVLRGAFTEGLHSGDAVHRLSDIGFTLLEPRRFSTGSELKTLLGTNAPGIAD